MIFSILQLIKIILGLIYLLFLPGFVLSFFLIQDRNVISIKRITFSIALSCTIAPVIVFYGYKIGFPVKVLNIILEILLVLITSVCLRFLFKKHFKNEHKKNSYYNN